MRICEICEKGSKTGGKRNLLRGKYNPTSQKRKKPNLQWAHLESGKKALLCARCIKKLYK